jgi:RND family efflux transporter MFP subunit
MSRKTLFIIATIIIIGGIAATVIFQKVDKAPYELATVQRGDMVQDVSVSGKIESPTKVDLQFKNSGKITFLQAHVGQSVAVGEVLARQDANLLYSQLRQSQAALKNQEYRLKSRKDNQIKNYDDEYDIKAQKAVVKQAQADVNAQWAKINEAVITSPIDGVIVAINSELGEIAKPETTVLSVISNDKLQIDVDIPETAIANVAIGQTARITLDAFEDAIEWTGRVMEIDSTETIKGGAVYYKTTVFFDREDDRFRSGMTANLWIKTAISENALFVPISALQKNDNKNIVQVFQKEQMLEREVEIGLKNDAGMVEIISGLMQDEQIIIGKKK